MDLLTINKKDASADDDKGPSVESENQQERIEARRLRIKKKKEQSLRGKEPASDANKRKELTKARKQVQDSRARLVKLEKDGLELVTNVRVAGDAREHARRTDEEEIMRLRKERLEQEAKSATEKFEEIVKKWDTAQSKYIPQELHEMLMDQKQLCDTMIDEKNKMINDFKMELKNKDDNYVKTLKKYGEEIDLLIERMKDQTINMRKFYLEELVNIENAFIAERKELLDKHNKDWNDKMTERNMKEVAFLKERFNRVERNEKDLNELIIKNAEENNEKKIQLETDVQVVEQKLQQMKAIFQLNQEKLEYNYQVLVKREEENSKTKAVQKRKITKLNDALTNLKKKLTEQIKMFNDENQQLSENYKKVSEMFNDLKLKSKHFLAVDLKKFHDIWKMNEEQCKILANNLLEADRIIHEHQLGLEWVSPDVSFMDNIGPIQDADKTRSGKEFVTELFISDDEKEEARDERDDEEEDIFLGEENTDLTEENTREPSHPSQSEYERTNTEAESVHPGSAKKSVKFQKEASQFKESARNTILNLSKYTLRNILMLICDEAGFLLEQKLAHLLKPLEKNEQSMIQLDSIFKALSIETDNDVKLLAQYFIDHRKYKELIRNRSFTQKLSVGKVEAGVGPGGLPNDSSDLSEQPSISSSSSPTAVNAKTVPTDQIRLIDPNEVVSALKTFVYLHRKSEDKPKLSKFRLKNLDNRSDLADQEYWQKYQNLIDDKKEKVWDAMLYALQKYHGILIRRSELLDENKQLANQNAELRMLLAQYMQSSVNQDLQIPPTQILQMEYNRN